MLPLELDELTVEIRARPTLIGHGIEKFIGTGLIATSASRSWTLLSAEIRSHSAGEIGAFTPQNGEITQVLKCGEAAISDRASGGVRQEVQAHAGTMWLCPSGIREEATRLSVDFHACLHIYMPHHSFLRLSNEGHGDFGAQDLRYEAQLASPAVHEMTAAIARELNDQTSSGSLKMDELAIKLISTLAQHHAETSPCRLPTALAKGILDRRRLSRVLEFIDANMESEISVTDLADVACFSLFHFVRAFHSAMGCSPHAYLSERRLDRAKSLLEHSETSLVDVALGCQFSGQANFTKAFTRSLGVSPGRYRRAFR
jgi:AraC family transcriptional regulator